MKKKINNPIVSEVFKIHQIPKVEGLRKHNKYQPERFSSPIFGTNVKDEVTVGITAKTTGDKNKQLESFRAQKQMTKEQVVQQYGDENYDFQNQFISSETREELLGIKAPNKIIAEEPSIQVESTEMYQESFEQEEQIETEPINNVIDTPIWLRNPQPAQITPEEAEVPIKTFERPIVVKPPIVTQPVSKPVTPVVKETSNIVRRLPKYNLPSTSIFTKSQRNNDEKPQWLIDQIEVINQTLTNHGIDAEVFNSIKGPTVTRYEIKLNPGVNVKKILSIQDNIMMNLAATSLRVEAPIPGKPYVGIEVPNKVAELVAYGDIVDTKGFLDDERPLRIALGEDIDGKNIYVDIAKMPHGLIAGGTGSGKSVCVNTILVSLLLRNKPEDLKLILIDPKMVELKPYDDLPHLITPVITDAKMSAQALNWAVEEMERRYRKFAEMRSRDIISYNQNLIDSKIDEEKMPYIVIIIDELADLMMVAAQDVEDAIQRLTQKARAAGIHLLVATQRPTTDVVKGTIKSNIPFRIAFKVSSFVDSTTILDGQGAENLLGRGDMLMKENDRTIRIQGAFIKDKEIDTVIDFIKDQRSPSYIFKHDDLRKKVEIKEQDLDPIFESVAYYVVENNVCSINQITKEFSCSFNRAQAIVKSLEQYQIVSESAGTKARDVLVSIDELEGILAEVRGIL